MDWYAELKALPLRPGEVDNAIWLYEEMQSEKFKVRAKQDLLLAIIGSISSFERMNAALKNDPIAKPTKNERKFHEFAKRVAKAHERSEL